MASALDEIGRRMSSGRWPSTFGRADAAVIAGLGYLAIRHGRALIEQRAGLLGWLESHAARPSVVQTAPP